jgi:serine/threonine-protein kinase
MTPTKPRFTLIVGISFTLLVTLVALFPPSSLMAPELFLYDLAMKLPASAKELPTPNVVLIEIDEKSSMKLGPWPWPRQLLAEMVALLGKDGAKVIGLHVPLMERQPHSGLKELRAFRERFNAYSFSKKDEGLRPWVLENLDEAEKKLDSDRMLVERTKLAGNVIFPAFVRFARTGDESLEEMDPVLLHSTIVNNGLTFSSPERVSRISAPLANLAQAARGFGHAGFSLKKGMEGRSHPLFIPYKDRLLPSFPLRAAMAFLGHGMNQLSVEGSQARIQNSIITLWDGEMLVDFRGSRHPLERYSFCDVLQEKKVPVSAAGKIVLIGFNLDETRKIATPLSPAVPVLDFNAYVIQALLEGQFIQRPPYMTAIELASAWIVGFFSIFLFMRFRYPGRLAGMAALFSLVLGCGFLLFSHGLWMKTGLTAIFLLALCPVLAFSSHISKKTLTAASSEVNRSLGISLQARGLLDQAFEHFRKLPFDLDARDLIYRLGLEYEDRGMIEKAISAYEIIHRGGDFRDVDDRLRRLRNSGSPTVVQGQAEAEQDLQVEEESGRAMPMIARYEVIQELGKGSMGMVYKARDPKLNRLLAIKTIRFSDEFDPEVVQEVKARFLREAEIAGRLSHPSIVTVYDVGEDQDLTYMAMEYLVGDDLEKFITKGHLLPLTRVLEVVASVADALEYAHRAGVIHRDVKPANIMLLKQGGVKVTDFGIAKAVSSTRTRTGVIIGTPNYMSPEQIMGQRIDYRTDIFSLGVLFYQSVTGELPFQGDNLSNLLYQITQAKHTPAKELAPRLPKACEQIIDKALAKNPNQRFSSAGEVGRLVRLIISRLDQIKKPLSA